VLYKDKVRLLYIIFVDLDPGSDRKVGVYQVVLQLINRKTAQNHPQIQVWNACLPVTCDCLDSAVVSAERNVESNDSVAGLDELEVLLGDVSLASSSVEEELYLLKETRLLESVKFRSEVGRVHG